MKKFLFVVTFVVLSQVSLAEETNSANHASTTDSNATAASTTAPQKPVAVDHSAKIFEYLNACLAGRPVPTATSSTAVSK